MRTQIASVILLAMLTPSAASPDALADRVAALTKPFKGTVVFYAKNLKTGKDFGVGADTKVKTASTIKLPILCTLESLVAQGKVRWDERIVLKPDDKVTGSGVLGSLADGTHLKEPTGWSREGLLEENKKYGLGVSTAREMVQLLEMLEQGKIVSAAASKDILDILKMQQERDG